MNWYKLLSLLILLVVGVNIHLIFANMSEISIQVIIGLIYSVLLMVLSRYIWKIGSESK